MGSFGKIITPDPVISGKAARNRSAGEVAKGHLN